jgi:small subunit ribosomal protein S1
VDAELTGTVEKRAPFGLFVALSPGITGLLPTSVIQASASRNTLERLNVGDAVSVRVKEIDVRGRRISLAPVSEDGVREREKEEKDWKRHAPKPVSAPPMGALGLALQAAIKNKK